MQASTTLTGVPAPTVVTTAAGTAGAAAGVLGAQATIVHPAKAHAAGGVLGAVTRLGRAGTRSTLPFTGFPLWMTVLIAVGLILSGLTVRTRTGAAS